MCEVEELRRTCDIAGSLLLKSPEQELIDWIKQCTGQNLAIKECQQAFYDYFCFPQSGLFCPPYNHVFSNGLRHGDIWQFPAASFDGGAEEEDFYQKFNFAASMLNIKLPMVHKHVPGDHFGVELLFISCVLTNENLNTPDTWNILKGFICAHLPALKGYTHLLGSQTDPYIKVVAECLEECLLGLDYLLSIDS